MKKLLLWLSYVALTCNYCLAQSSLQGIIRDNNESLPYSTITLVRQHASAPVITQADSLAHFSFSDLSDGHYTLSAYALGYTKFTLSLDIKKDTVIHIILHPLQSNLKGVTVTESKPVIEQKPDR
ncbi:MAG: carboxypeptidase regulatory-like domain-containing protein, partial [Chitinophagaceae bacterium]